MQCRGSKAGTLRGSGAHTDSVLVRDLGLRTPSSSGRSRPCANLSDDMSLVAGDIFGDSGVVVVWTSSRIVTKTSVEACRDVRGRRDVASPRNESPFLGSKAGSANTEMWRSSGIFAEDPAT